MIAIWGCFCGPEGVINSSCGNNVSLLDWGYPFPDCWGKGKGQVGLWAVSKIESSARAHLAFRGLSCWFRFYAFAIWGWFYSPGGGGGGLLMD